MSFRYSRTALLLAVICLASQPSYAAEISRKSFTKFGTGACPLSGGCNVDFGTVPANHIYEVTSVSCYLSIENVNGRVLYWYLYALKSGASVLGRIHLRPTSLGTTSTAHTYSATETTMLRVPSGASIGVSMTRDGSTAGGVPNIDCTIGGADVRVD